MAASLVLSGVRSRRNALFVAAMLALPAFCVFHGLTAFGLLNNVEGLYAEIGREMLADGNWIIPHLNGLPYIEKPPLLYWLSALSMSLFGVNEFAVRLVSALAGLASVALVGWFGTRRCGVRCGLVAAFMLGTSAGLFLLSKVALTDALLALLLNAALLFAYAAFVEQRRGLLRGAYVCLALAILAKGFVALALFCLTWIAYVLSRRQANWRSVLRFMAEPWAVALFLLFAVPWHVAAALSLREFAWFYFINEHVLRFLGLREPKDYYSGSVFYYLPRLAGFFMPWCIVLLASFVRRSRIDRQSADLSSFLRCVALVPLVFFSVSSAKANYYVIVCLPALALLTALALERWLDAREGRDARGFERAVLIGVLLAGFIMAPLEAYFEKEAEKSEANFSARSMARVIAAQDQTLPVFLYRDFEDYSGLPFYLQSKVGVIDQRSEDLMFGLRVTGPSARFPDAADFIAGYPAAWVVVRDQRQRDLRRSELAGRLVEVARVGNATLYRWPGT